MFKEKSCSTAPRLGRTRHYLIMADEKNLNCADDETAAKKATQEVKMAKTSALKMATECILSCDTMATQLF